MENNILDSKLRMVKLNDRLKKLKEKAGFIVQSLLFPKSDYSVSEAKKWASKHKYKSSKVDVTDNFIRLRQKDPGKFSTFRTKLLGDGIKAVLASNLKSKFAVNVFLSRLSKFQEEQIKSDKDLLMPMHAEIQIFCEGPNRDGFVEREDLEESLERWGDLPLIDWHDMDNMNEPTKHKISDRVGYTMKNPRLQQIEGKWWIIVPAEIINRDFAYQLYLRDKRGKPIEASAEFGKQTYLVNGLKRQININPHLISFVDNGHIEGNKVKLAST